MININDKQLMNNIIAYITYFVITYDNNTCYEHYLYNIINKYIFVYSFTYYISVL